MTALLRPYDQTEPRFWPRLRLALAAAAVLAVALAVSASAAGWSELVLRGAFILLLLLLVFTVQRPLVLVPLFALGIAGGAAGSYLLAAEPERLPAALLTLCGLLVFGLAAVLLGRAAAAVYGSRGGRGAHAFDGIDPDTGAFEERLLRGALEAELARARRFRRCFALVLVMARPRDPDARRRETQTWKLSYVATAQLLLRTRLLVDRVYLYGPSGFAMILPESGPREVTGLIRRLRRLGRLVQPPEGQPGGPFPVAFGATFYPDSATTVDALLTRASLALKLATKSGARYHLDGAEVPEPPPPESLRTPDESTAVEDAQPEAAAAGAAGLVNDEDDMQLSRDALAAAEDDVWLKAYASVFGEAEASAGGQPEQTLEPAPGAVREAAEAWNSGAGSEGEAASLEVRPASEPAATGDEDAAEQAATAEVYQAAAWPPAAAECNRGAMLGLDGDALRSGLAELLRDLERATLLIRSLRGAGEEREPLVNTAREG